MYQLDKKPKEWNLHYLIAYLDKMRELLMLEMMYSAVEASNQAQEDIYGYQEYQRLNEGYAYYQTLGFLWACHDYLEGDEE